MKTILSAKEMKKCDYNTINYYGIKSSTLMERASLSVFSVLSDFINFNSRILVFVGTGNNGGDGVCLARLLHNYDFNVSILLCGDEDKFSPDLVEQLEISRKYNIKEVDIDCINEYDVFIDAILGIGLSRDVTGEYARYVTAFNKATGFKMAIDIPSGINTDNGSVMGVACKVNATVSFNYRKPGHLLYPGREYAGNTFICDIGINRRSFLDDINPYIYCVDEEDIKILDNRNEDTNKGDYGKVLVIAGSKGMSGAAYLCAKAALRTGAGLVKIYTTSDNRTILQSQFPEAIVSCYDTFDEMSLRKEMEWSTVCAIGPGISKSDIAKNIVEYVVKRYDKPLVIDADAINIISNNKSILKDHNNQIIITPHLGEMKRLIGGEIPDIKNDMINKASDCTKEYNVITVLKSAATVVSLKENVFINTSGNNGMATAGSGDVLTGIITGLIANNINPEYAAVLGVYLHGLCGDKASEKLGAHFVNASDIIEMISVVLKEGF